MKLSGLYHWREGEDNPSSTWIRNSWKFLSLIVAAICVGGLCYCVINISKNLETNALFAISDLAWNMVVAVYVVTFFKISHRSDIHKEFYMAWAEMRFNKDEIEITEKKITRQTWIYTILTATVIFFCWSIQFYEHFQRINSLKVHYYVLEAVESTFVGFILLVCSSLKIIMSTLNARFLSMLKSPLEISSWEQIRQGFHSAFRLIEITNNLFSFCIGLCIISFVYEVVVYSSSVIMNNEETNNIAWTLLYYGIILSLLWTLAEVNDEAQEFFNHLSKIKLSNYPISLQNEIIFFQNRVGNPCTVGITVFKAHLINRGFATSIISAYLTYLLIVLQMTF